MELDLISLETAKLLKEKGFDLKTHDYYSMDRYESEFSLKQGFNDEYWGDNYFHDWNTNGEPYKPFSKDCYSAPQQALLVKWLMETHNIVVTPYPIEFHKNNNILPQTEDVEYAYYYFKDAVPQFVHGNGYPSYGEALEVGLREALKLLEDGK